jgi:hypothetical protein
MKKTAYSYTVLIYCHDPAVGELLNIGVLVYAPKLGFARSKIDSHYRRLSNTFVDFDGGEYRCATARILGAVEDFQKGLQLKQRDKMLKDAWGDPLDAAALAAIILPDKDLSFRFGPVRKGLTSDIEDELDYLYGRFVSSPHGPGRDERRTDEDIWSTCRDVFARESVLSGFQKKRIETPDGDMEFDSAFKNERWHLLQPISMDHVRPETISNKAARWAGHGLVLQDCKDLDKLHMLLGAPSNLSNRRAYEKAKNLLGKMPIAHEIIEDDELEDFARSFAEFMRRHGVDKD